MESKLETQLHVDRPLSLEDRQYYFDQWKHFESAGGEDKNRMINLVTWIFALIAGISGYTFSHLPGLQSKDRVIIGITILFIAIIAMIVVIIFNYYANFNWRIAQRIEETHLMDLQNLIQSGGSSRYTVSKSPLRMAPVFIVFTVISGVLIAGALIMIFVGSG